MIRLSSDIVEIPMEKIILSTSQARQRDTKVAEDDDLVYSIRKSGLINPITVKHLPDDKYELVAGQRRFRAHEILNKPTIKSCVVEGDIDELDAKRISLIENAARKDMKHADYVDAIDHFMQKYGSTRTVAEELGLNVGTVRKYLKIGRLPPRVRDEVKSGKVSLDVAIKALNAQGGDEERVHEGRLLETITEMKKIPSPARTKFVEIQKNEPDSSPEEVAKKAVKRTVLNKITVEFTEDQLSRIDRFKKNEGIGKREEAASTLIDKGLDAADL